MTGFMNLVADISLLAFELDTNLVGSELQSLSLDSQALRTYQWELRLIWQLFWRRCRKQGFIVIFC